jgi:predicted 3-demethylubiquinone-9 3-methyltransferase (glyoxalase superfamily)
MSRANLAKSFLWFDGNMAPALEFYQSLLPDFVLHSKNEMNGELFIAEFSIAGHEFIGMNQSGAPKFNDSFSLMIQVTGQEEVDRIWNGITAEGEEVACGWCRDKFGLTFQILPHEMRDWMEHPAQEVREYAWAAMMKMKKIIIADLIMPGAEKF